MEYENIDWEDEPKWSALDSVYSEEQEVTTKYHKIIELAFLRNQKDEVDLFEYSTIHKKIRVLGDDAIQYHNKVYIGLYGGAQLIEAKARVITPDNKVIDFDESNIQESEGEGEVGKHMYFAIDGIVKGSDIEYTYTVLRAAELHGRRLAFQDDYYQTNLQFTLATPSNLGFAFKSYNGFPEVVVDSTNENEDKIIHRVFAEVVPPLHEEEYAAYEKNLQSVVYMLDKVYSTGQAGYTSFGEISQKLYNSYFGEPEKSDAKAIKKIVSASGATKLKSEEEQVRALEKYLKSNIVMIDGVPTKPVKDIIEDGYTSSIGMLYLTVQSLRQLDITPEMVLTCNRYENFFDKDFEHYAQLNESFLYFPNLKMYMAPSEQTFRLGMIPASWTSHNGLFIKEISIGDIYTGLGKVEFVEPLPYDKTVDKMRVEVDFSEMATPAIDFERSLSGYSCVYFQALYNLIDEEGKKDLDEAYIKFPDQSGEIVEYSVKGTEEDDIGKNPMVYTGKMNTASVVEKAGNRYLFKIGQLIGPQAEMYEEKEKRVCDIEHAHNMTYDRQITFEIPDGFKVSGLEDLKINETYPAKDPVMLFVSDYKQEGNKVTVTIEETYKEMSFDKEIINDFRRIINAAANFNKVVLFLTKE